MHFVKIEAISYCLPDNIVTNDELASLYEGWTSEKIYDKTGIRERRVCGLDETACDIGEKAVRNLFVEHSVDPSSVEFIILATQSPDYYLPPTACILQDRLGIPKSSGALDINLGCSAYVYGLSLAKGLVAANICNSVLLVTADSYSKYLHPMDKSVRTVFGDGASATLVSAFEKECIKNFVLGTDGSGFDRLIVPAGGARLPKSVETQMELVDESGNIRTQNNLFMDGTEIFSFTHNIVPQLVTETLMKNDLDLDSVDLFVFHQANRFMLDFLRKKCKIPENKFYMNFEDCGNTVSSSIPIALARAVSEGVLAPGMTVMLVGFGVGLSWASCVIEW